MMDARGLAWICVDAICFYLILGFYVVRDSLCALQRTGITFPGWWQVSKSEFLILSILPTSSGSFNHDGYEKNKLNQKFKRAIQIERLEAVVSAKQIESVYNNYEPVTVADRSRFYRQADSEAFTSIEPIAATENSTPFGLNDLSDKYNTSATTELMNDKTIIPLTSKQEYDSSESPELTETKEPTKVIPIITTDKTDYLKVQQLNKNDSTVETMDVPKKSKNYDYIGSTSNLNQDMEFVTPSTQKLDLSEKIKSVDSPNELEVVGISKMEKHAERIMQLQPSKDEKYVWLKETVHNLLENTMLRRETEEYVIQLYQRYDDLPKVKADNSKWTKYSRAVVESFVLDFYRNYPHYTASEEAMARWYRVEEYQDLYNSTLLRLQQKKGKTALQFAAAVRRAADIYKAILDTPIGIVQSKCVDHMPHWLCFAEYLVRLSDMSKTCEHVWYHAQVHLMVLQSTRLAKGPKNPVDGVIAELDLRLSTLEPNNDVNYLFDFILQVLSDLSMRLKEPLLSEASIFSLIRKLQSEDKLNCMSIDEKGW